MNVLDLINIPVVLRSATLEAIPPQLHYMSTIENYLETLDLMINKGQGLYLWGNYGRGKSALAAIILMTAYAEFKQLGYWVNAKKIAGFTIHDTIWQDDITIMQRCESACLLVIDEFQVRSDVKFQETVVEDLLRDRIAAKKATVMTSNLAPNQVEAAYPAMYSVLQESTYPVYIDGYDFRASAGGLKVSSLNPG